MSGRAFSDAFGGHEPDDGSYRAWQTCQQGSVMNFKVVPARSTGEPVRQIPYLQPITIEHHRDTDQLCLLCHSTGMTVFLEGRGLDELADAIAEKRVKVVTMFDAAEHPEAGNDKAVVTSIRIEQSS